MAAAATLCAAAWVVFNIAGNYRGHISGIFYTSSGRALPADLDGSRTYRVKDEVGYDGQFYRLIAHDPLNWRGFLRFTDNPPLRWRRIGIPALANLLAAGNDGLVDFAYVALQLAFVFAGAFWLALYAQLGKQHAAWGLAFLLIPAVAVSLDRMTIDLALAALTIGLAYFSREGGPRWALYVALCAAPLVRETGIVLVAAWCVYSALRREWLGAFLGGCCAFPALAWWGHVYGHTNPDGTPWFSRYPFSGIIDRTVLGVASPVSTVWLQAAAFFENLALAGIWIALALAFYLTWKRRLGLLEITAIAFAVFAAALGKFDIWESAYAAGRTMSPMLIALGLIALRDRRVVFAVPLLLILPRIALQYEAQVRNALRG